MATDFFIKKGWGYIGLSCVCILFSLCAFFYAAFINRAQTVWHGKNFYFLLSPTENVEVGIFDAQLDGGAGYLLHHNGQEAVALAVYFQQEDALKAQVQGTENLEVLHISVDRLYFKTRCEKKNAELYQGALSALYSCMQILGQEIYRLDNGATQSSSLSTLKILQRQFSHLRKQYKEKYAVFSEICQTASCSLEKIIENTIYASDLRYVLCALTEGYVQLTKEFSL